MKKCPDRLFTALWRCLPLLALAACATGQTGPAPQAYQYEVTARQNHDATLFTQGLLRRGDLFYESGGGYGQSRLVAYTDDGEKSRKEHKLKRRYFAEGLTEFDGNLYLLTWREQTLLVFDARDLEPTASHSYKGEGWGLTDNGEQLIRSDGSTRLYFHDPETFAVQKHITVTEQGRPVERLNELEYINGHIWANIWREDRIVQIDPENGAVVGRLDLSELASRARPQSSRAVLNGIAHDREHNELWVTGKLWEHLYRLKLSPGI